MYCDSRDTVTANIALEIFHKIMENDAEWDQWLRQRTVKEMVGNAEMIEIYADDSDDLSMMPRKEFISQMSLAFACIDPDGSIHLDFNVPGDDEHGWDISIDIPDEILTLKADIERHLHPQNKECKK